MTGIRDREYVPAAEHFLSQTEELFVKFHYLGVRLNEPTLVFEIRILEGV